MQSQPILKSVVAPSANPTPEKGTTAMNPPLHLNRIAATILIAALGLLGLSPGVLAVDNAFTGNLDGSWNNTGNWGLSTLPDASETVRFDAGSSVLSTTLDTVFSINGVRVEDVAGNVSVANGAGGPLTIGSGGVDLSGATANLTFANPIDFSADTAFDIAGGRQVTLNGMLANTRDIVLGGGGQLFLNTLNYSGWSGDLTLNDGTTLRVQDVPRDTASTVFGTGRLVFNDGVFRVEHNDGGHGRSFAKEVVVTDDGSVRFEIVPSNASRTFSFTQGLTGGENITVSKSATGSALVFSTATASSWIGVANFDIEGGTLRLSHVVAPEATGFVKTGNGLLDFGRSEGFNNTWATAPYHQILGGNVNLHNRSSVPHMLGATTGDPATVFIDGGALHINAHTAYNMNLAIIVGETAALRPGRGGSGDGANFSYTMTGPSEFTPGASLTIGQSAYGGVTSNVVAIGMSQATFNGGHVAFALEEAPSGSSALTRFTLANAAVGVESDGLTWSIAAQPNTEFRYSATAPARGSDAIYGFATVGDDFAHTDGTNTLAFTGYNALGAAGGDSDTTYETTGDVTMTAGQDINALKIDNAAGGVLDLGGNALRVQSGGLLFAGAAVYAIDNGQLAAGGGAKPSDFLYIHQRSTETATIGADIAGTAGLVKTGGGLLELGGANTYGGTTYVNQGTLALVGGGTLAGDVLLHAAGMFDLAAITGNAYTLPTGATLGGVGTVDLGNTDLTVQGVVSPGFSAGTLTFVSAGGDFIVGSGGVLQMEIFGSEAGEYDRIVLDGGNFVAGGTLELVNLFAETPELGTTIQLFDVNGSFSGSFATLLGGNLGGDYFWDTGNLLVDGTITVAIPEPASGLLLALLAGLGVRRRRRG